MKRRKFIHSSIVASTAAFIPVFIKKCNSKDKEIDSNLAKAEGKKIIVIQLSGGNDGINTFIPYQNDIYYKNRPKIHIPKKEVLKTTDSLGLHPAMGSIEKLFDSNLISIINSVGYPNATRSHFRSMDVWHNASNSLKKMEDGWIGRYLDHNCTNNLGAIEIDDTLSLALKGKKRNGFSLSDSEKLKKACNSESINKVLANSKENQGNSKVDFLYKTLSETKENAHILHDKVRTYRSTVNYPQTPFGQDLRLIAQLITSDLPTKIYYASLSGFDTHAGQKIKHSRLLTNFSQSVSALVQDLQNHKIFDDCTIMVFSEFGRRLKENGSMGTDHGKGNNLMLIGSKLSRPGIFNDAPDLTNLDEGDVKFDIDFRRIYAAILDNWLEVDSNLILPNKFQPLNIFS